MNNLPLCPEVCTACRGGIHLFHVMTEFGDLWAVSSMGQISFHGYTNVSDKADDCFKEDLANLLKQFGERK